MKSQGIIGSIIMAAGGLCPLMHLPIIGNWNYFGIDVYMASIFYAFVVLGLIGAFTQKAGLLRFSGWMALLIAALTLLAIYFKAHDYFSFIPIKKLANLASGIVKYKWGWFVILAGALMLVTVKKPIH